MWNQRVGILTEKTSAIFDESCVESLGESREMYWDESSTKKSKWGLQQLDLTFLVKFIEDN